MCSLHISWNNWFCELITSFTSKTLKKICSLGRILKKNKIFRPTHRLPNLIWTKVFTKGKYYPNLQTWYPVVQNSHMTHSLTLLISCLFFSILSKINFAYYVERLYIYCKSSNVRYPQKIVATNFSWFLIGSRSIPTRPIFYFKPLLEPLYQDL